MALNLITNIGFILLAIYLILVGVLALVPTLWLPSFLLGIVAIAAGVFILIGK